MTTLYIDTEFNSYRGELISLGIAATKSDESFYMALHCADPDPWVAKHVLPVLYTEPVGLNRFQASLQKYLMQFPTIHVVADWPEDIQHFCWALITGPGERLDTPPLTFEIRRDLNSDKSQVPHNALFDALAIREMTNV